MTSETTITQPDGWEKKLPYASVLGTRCAELARAVSYHDPEPVGAIKQTLREAAYFIDSQCIRVHKKKDGLLLINSRGRCRFMTWRERIAYWLLRGKTEIRP